MSSRSDNDNSAPSRASGGAPLLFLLPAAFLAGAILWASLTASLGESLARALADPWGVVMLIDLYAGFAVAIALYATFERPRTAALLAAGTLLLGNVVTLAWLAWRGWSKLSARASRVQ